MRNSLFSFKNFIVLAFTFRSIIHFEKIFVYSVRKTSNFILLYLALLWSWHQVERLCFPHWNVWPLIKNKLTLKTRVTFWTSNSISLICMLTVMPISYFLHYRSFVVSFEVGKFKSSSLVFFFKTMSPIMNHLHFLMSFNISLSISTKKNHLEFW